MAFGNGYIIGFAAGICVVCSLAVATVSQSLKERQELNVQRDFQSNVLMALGLPETGEPLKGEAIDQLYAERVEVIIVDPQGNIAEGASLEEALAARDAAEEGVPELLTVYQRVDEGQPTAYAIPTFGTGLWGPISGFIALDTDGETVIGSTFFAPKETPGLGYEITQPWFRNQFVGKKIYDDGEFVPVRVVKGDADLLCPGEVEHCVDGVSGATITARGVGEMIAEAVDHYEPFLQRIQQGG